MFYGCYKGVEGLFFLKTGEKGDRKGSKMGERWNKNTKNPRGYKLRDTKFGGSLTLFRGIKASDKIVLPVSEAHHKIDLK